MKKLNIIFIGGLTNGQIVLDYLGSNTYVNVPLVLTYPKHHNVPRYIELIKPNGNTMMEYNLDSNSILSKIAELEPDYIFVAGWSNILSAELLEIPKYGTIGFHPSRLPNDRGRSVLAWQIEDGYTKTSLSMFYYNEIPDCGDIIAQEKIKIEYNDYIADVLDKIDFATYNMMKAYFPMLRKRIAPRVKQDINEGNFRRLRTGIDSQINWDKNVDIIYNKIRAISKPYPGSIGIIGEEKYLIWKAIRCKPPAELRYKVPGNYILNINGFPTVRCRDGCLKILDYEKL